MMMTSHNSTTSHHEFTFEDGEVVVDKCRNTLGGFNNMVQRLEQRVGGRVRFDLGGGAGTANGRRFTVQTVGKL